MISERADENLRSVGSHQQGSCAVARRDVGVDSVDESYSVNRGTSVRSTTDLQLSGWCVCSDAESTCGIFPEQLRIASGKKAARTGEYHRSCPKTTSSERA